MEATQRPWVYPWNIDKLTAHSAARGFKAAPDQDMELVGGNHFFDPGKGFVNFWMWGPLAAAEAILPKDITDKYLDQYQLGGAYMTEKTAQLARFYKTLYAQLWLALRNQSQLIQIPLPGGTSIFVT